MKECLQRISEMVVKYDELEDKVDKITTQQEKSKEDAQKEDELLKSSLQGKHWYDIISSFTRSNEHYTFEHLLKSTNLLDNLERDVLKLGLSNPLIILPLAPKPIFFILVEYAAV